MARLTSPAKIQAFLDDLPYSAEDRYRCPLTVLRDRTAHCFDGALFAAAGLRGLQTDYPIIGDVRGKGLMTGIEFVKAGGRPNPEAVEQIKARLLETGVLISRVGPYNHVLRCAPPLVITAQQVEEFLQVFRGAVDGIVGE